MMAWLIANWKLVIGGLGVLFITGFIIGFWSFVANLQEANRILSEKVGQFEVALEVQKTTIDSQKEALIKWSLAQKQQAQILQEINQNANKARDEVKQLGKLFGSHDFKNLVDKKPDSIERIINRGTSRTFRMFECSSGSSNKNCVVGNSSTPKNDSSS
jgi:predicted site-specific integrase-resolvase